MEKERKYLREGIYVTVLKGMLEKLERKDELFINSLTNSLNYKNHGKA